MTERLRHAISDEIARRATSPTAVARAIGHDGGYLREFLRGRKDSISAASIADLEQLWLMPHGQLSALAAHRRRGRAPLSRDRGCFRQRG